MEKEEFIKRLTELRMNKGVSARDMSLSLGQSPGYINNIENGVNLPSMTVFFYICDYFGILDDGMIATSGDLYEAKDHIHKIQLAFKEELDRERFDHLELLSFKKQSRVINMVVKGDIEDIKTYLNSLNPLLLEVLPVNLEEIFIYEMERKGYGIYEDDQ